MHINNVDLRREISAYQAALRSDSTARVPEALGALLLLLCQNLAERKNWRGYVFVQDLVAAGALDCVKACAKIDLGRNTSLFAYFTTVATRAFIAELRLQRRLGFTPKRPVRPIEIPERVPMHEAEGSHA